MAVVTFKKGEDYVLRLSKLADQADEVAKKAIYAGANIVADGIKAGIDGLPVEKFRYLRGGDSFIGVTSGQKKDLQESFGITPISKDRSGNLNAKIGFDGYGRYPTDAYPGGLPNQLLARAIESGSSVRQKRPFVRPAVNRARKAAVAAMGRVIDEALKKLFD